MLKAISYRPILALTLTWIVGLASIGVHADEGTTVYVQTRYHVRLAEKLLVDFENRGLEVDIIKSSKRDPYPLIALSGLETLVSEARQALNQYRDDRNVELTVHLVRATAQEGPTTIPPILEPTIAELQKVFVYKSYSVLETAFMRMRDGTGGNVSGFLPAEKDDDASRKYQLDVDDVRIARSMGRDSVFLRRFNVGVEVLPDVSVPATNVQRVLLSRSSSSVGLRVDFDIRAGQNVVVGKTEASTGETLFVVVSVEIVD